MRQMVAVRVGSKIARGARKSLAAAIICGSVLLLSSCRIFTKEDPPPCPRISILSDAEYLVQFRPGAGRTASDITATAHLARFHGSCFYKTDAREMTLTMQVGIDAEAGPAMTSGKSTIAYFVAVPAFYPRDEAKRIIPVTLDFAKSGNSLSVMDADIALSFPVRSLRELERYEIFLGFQLDDAQLEYNRAHPHH